MCFPFFSQTELQSNDWVVDWRVKREELFMAASKIEDQNKSEDNAINEDDPSSLVGVMSTNENDQSDSYKIPKIIWQTAKSHNAPAAVAKIMSTWRDKNPGWDQCLLDDAEVDVFMVQHFNESVVAAFRKLPLPVMRADFFRLAVVYHLGGTYADVDVECSVPINDWAVNKCEVVIGAEPPHEVNVCNWGFASVKHHLLFQRAIDMSLSRFVNQDIDFSYEHFVHHTTGPVLLLDALGSLAAEAGCEWHKRNRTAREIYKSCRAILQEQYNICFVDGNTQDKWFHNHFSSQKVRDTCHAILFYIACFRVVSLIILTPCMCFRLFSQTELQSNDWVVDWRVKRDELFMAASKIRDQNASEYNALNEDDPSSLVGDISANI
jgi:mannosyltransferase OCH1-like enzyme